MFKTLNLWITFILLGIAFQTSGEAYRRGDVLSAKDTINYIPRGAKIAVVKIFHSLDINKDRVITKKDYKNQFDVKNKIEYIIEIADANRDGKITYSELFDAKNLIKDEFITLNASAKSSHDQIDTQWALIEDYGMIIGLFGMIILIAGFKFI